MKDVDRDIFKVVDKEFWNLLEVKKMRTAESYVSDFIEQFILTGEGKVFTLTDEGKRLLTEIIREAQQDAQTSHDSYIDYFIRARIEAEEETKTCPRCKEPWDEAGGCKDPECPCDK